MKHLTRTLKHLKERESLSPKERHVLRSKLSEYRAYTPLRHERVDADTRLPHLQPHGSLLLITKKPMPLIAGLILAASVSGGTAFAAEGAVPGDLLYPIKTEVTENVRSAIALNAEAKAEVDAWRATRRLDEAQKLAVRVELSDEKRAELEKRFAEHATRIEVGIASIEATDPALAIELATRIEASLAAREALLTNTDASSTASIGTAVRTTAIALGKTAVPTGTVKVMSGTIAVGEAYPETADTTDLATTAKRMYAAADAALTHATALYAKVDTELDDTTRTRVDAHLKMSAETFAEGQQHYDSGAHSEALLSFQSVVRMATHLTVFLQAHIDGTTVIDLGTFPLIEPLPPVRIDLSGDTLTPAGPPPDTGVRDVDEETGEQIDPPSLERDTGPEAEDSEDTGRIHISL